MSTPDAHVMFELTSQLMSGGAKSVLSGYRPHYKIRPDYLTSVRHRFLDDAGVTTGERKPAEVWFLTPEAYPHSLWEGQILEVAEGARVVGTATIMKVLNPLLLGSRDTAE
jgi:hypothetical protein